MSYKHIIGGERGSCETTRPKTQPSKTRLSRCHQGGIPGFHSCCCENPRTPGDLHQQIPRVHQQILFHGWSTTRLKTSPQYDRISLPFLMFTHAKYSWWSITSKLVSHVPLSEGIVLLLCHWLWRGVSPIKFPGTNVFFSVLFTPNSFCVSRINFVCVHVKFSTTSYRIAVVFLNFVEISIH